MLAIYQKNLISSFFKCLGIVTLVFFCISVILNVFEELSFFKNVENVNFTLPIFLTILNTPSILFDIFPFIFLISTLYFFSEIIDKNELNIYKNYGLTNFKIINIITASSFITGIFIVIIFYNISANLKFFYLDIKNDFSKDDKYLAVITSNGLWVKDETENNINLINAEKIENNHLKNVIITQFNKNFEFQKIISSDKVNIKEKIWLINNPSITKENQLTTKEKNILFETNFDKEKISSLFSNLSSLNILDLNELKKDYKTLGYSTILLNAHQLKLYSYPIYLSIMVCLASILMFNVRFNKSKIFNFILGILISVLIYYINFIFKLLTESEKIPLLVSVWAPQIILLLIACIGLVKVNEK
mgnify:FL=1|tara:strand:+ start:2015 stop:3097 length:1083 start_codon:yes stop_codon:yes gene_type:complete